MAQKQIAARLDGDDYQARFFWYLAAPLLFVDSNIESVHLEYDKATHVDDVAVFYKQSPKSGAGLQSQTDFYQVKYHVDQRDSYSANNLIDPSFINSPSKSLLQHFFEAYIKLRGDYSSFTLNLVSNWNWKADDILAKSIRDSGKLPDTFFSANESSPFGQIRKMWVEHLKTDNQTFLDFGRRLRLKLNYFGNVDFNTALSDRLHRAGLLPPVLSSLISPYDGLARKFIQTGTTSFEKNSLLAICEHEKLIQNAAIPRNIRTIGIRSFASFAENMANETDDFVCVSDQFDGRHARYGQSWIRAAISINEFIESRHQEWHQKHKVLLDCHTSFAILAGYLITKRAHVFPTGPRPNQELYEPISNENIPEKDLWIERLIPVTEGAPKLAVAVSVTHQVDRQVLDYLRQERSDASSLLILEPPTGTGPFSVTNADKALAMACSLVQIIRRHKHNTQQTYMFVSAPNFLSYFIGQQARAIGELTLFEYDFDSPEPRTYRESITLPLSIHK